MTALIPHPVLSPDRQDYQKECIFDTSIDGNVQRTLDGCIKIEMTTDLKSRFLSQQITDGNAGFFIAVRCPSTYARQVFQIRESKTTITLTEADYAEKITLLPYIAAIRNIEAFSSAEHDREFKGIRCHLPAGAILAMGDTHELTLDSIQKIGSAIQIIPEKSVGEDQYRIDLSGDKIQIRMHKTTFNRVRARRNARDHVLFPSLYMSAITHAIQELGDNLDRKWAQALTDSLKKRGYEPPYKESPYVIAQNLLENPLRHILKDDAGNE